VATGGVVGIRFATYTRPAAGPQPTGHLRSAVPDIVSRDIRAAFVSCLRTIERHQAYLTRLDAVLGDGDHGDNLAIGFRAVCESIDLADPGTPPGPLIRTAGYTLAASAGGASGPLYGTALIQAGLAAGSAEALDAATIDRMLDAAASAVASRGRCGVGDKTIYDALRPAADAFHQAQPGESPDASWPPRSSPPGMGCSGHAGWSHGAALVYGLVHVPSGIWIRVPCRASSCFGRWSSIRERIAGDRSD
jgi:hypothetical protein